MRSLLRFSLIALALALALIIGCGQKGPLTLKPLHTKTPVSAASNAPAATPVPAAPATAATPAPKDDKQTSADTPPAPRG